MWTPKGHPAICEILVAPQNRIKHHPGVCQPGEIYTGWVIRKLILLLLSEFSQTLTRVSIECLSCTILVGRDTSSGGKRATPYPSCVISCHVLSLWNRNGIFMKTSPAPDFVPFRVISCQRPHLGHEFVSFRVSPPHRVWLRISEILDWIGGHMSQLCVIPVAFTPSRDSS